MKKPSVKTVIPAILLVVIAIALTITVVYALSLESRVDGQYTEIARSSQADGRSLNTLPRVYDRAYPR